MKNEDEYYRLLSEMDQGTEMNIKISPNLARIIKTDYDSLVALGMNEDKAAYITALRWKP